MWLLAVVIHAAMACPHPPALLTCPTLSPHLLPTLLSPLTYPTLSPTLSPRGCPCASPLRSVPVCCPCGPLSMCPPPIRSVPVPPPPLRSVPVPPPSGLPLCPPLPSGLSQYSVDVQVRLPGAKKAVKSRRTGLLFTHKVGTHACMAGLLFTHKVGSHACMAGLLTAHMVESWLAACGDLHGFIALPPSLQDSVHPTLSLLKPKP